MAKKFDLAEALKLHGFAVKDYHGGGGAVILRRKWYQEVEVVWYGKQTITYAVQVFVNVAAEVCEVTYVKDGITYKVRWYDTTSKRTYNAIVETARCAGWEF